VTRGAGSLAGLLVLATIMANAVDARAPVVSPTAAHADVAGAAGSYTHAEQVAVGGGLTSPKTCRPVVRSSGYVNPLRGAKVKPERIDQGVDYAGSGRLGAIGAGRITYLATEGTGWPGAFIEYRLLDGPDVGCSVFYAEGVMPKPGLRVGETIRPGQALATIIPQTLTGFEIGWAAGTGTKTYAAAARQWTAADDHENVASGPGRTFSALIASLGGPPGKVEGAKR
jgi:hypothetical protein